MAQAPFHLAFPVSDLDATRDFFTDVLGCATGRQSDRWIDFDFLVQVLDRLLDRFLDLFLDQFLGSVFGSIFGSILLG